MYTRLQPRLFDLSGEDNEASDVWLGSRWACTGTHVIEEDERLLSRLPVTEVTS